jgi:hypothetical protein
MRSLAGSKAPGDGARERRFVAPLRYSVYRCVAIEGLLRAMPIVMADPQRELVGDFEWPGICRPGQLKPSACHPRGWSTSRLAAHMGRQ